MENLRKRTMVSAGGEIDYSKQYLTIVSLADSNTITWRCSTSSTSYRRYIYVSTDEGATWTYIRSSSSGTTLATLQNGGRLLIKYYNSATYGSSTSYYNYFTSTQDFNVEGNIMSMTTSSNFDSATSVGNYAFLMLFYNCTKLKSAENLVLPATTLGQYCYYRMFSNCTGLTTAPKKLPALTLQTYCYYQMFSTCSALTDAPEIEATTYAQSSCGAMFMNCTSLVTAPEIKATSLGNTYCCQQMFQGCTALVNAPSILPATTLTDYCYHQMFYGCSILETAPELPAATLTQYCYYRMFYSCSKLNRITCLATSVSASNCKYQWVSGVASSGTFIKNKDITTGTWSTGVSGIPSGWIVENYKTDISSATVTVADQKYTGSALTPSVTVTLNGSTLASSNYTVAYSDNTEVGTATVTVTGTGDYYGQATGHFEIVMQQTGVVSFSIDHVDKEEGDPDFTYAATKNGDGALTYSSSNTDVVTVNSSTGLVSLVGYGTATITATMAETVRYTGASDSYTVTMTPLFAVGETKSFSYTGSVQKVGLLPGTYQLQVWGAQGGSGNGNAGGNGGYSEGVLTVDEIKTLYAFVGGQGSTSGNGGWNGGGGSPNGYSSYSSGDEYGYSYFGCGGGATDFALKTSDMSYSSYRTGRSSESLLSRIIVAGGGSGGAMCYQEKTTSTTTTVTDTSGTAPTQHYGRDVLICSIPVTEGITYTITKNGTGGTSWMNQSVANFKWTNTSAWATNTNIVKTQNDVSSDTAPTGATYLHILDWSSSSDASVYNSYNSYIYEVTHEETTSSTNTYTDSQVGFVGGGTTGGGYNSNYQGMQDAGGTGGSFGQGANQSVTNYRYCSGAGGGGWYGGGGGQYNDNNMGYCKYSGGGSGFVNTAASAGYRPSGYTGLQLDSGSTTAGDSSFPAPSGGNEVGHADDGYAKITRTA